MDFSFILLLFAAMVLIGLFLFTLSVKRRGQLYYVFQAMLFVMICWTVGNIMAWYYYDETGILVLFFIKLWYIGTCYVPVLFFLAGLLFTNNRFSLSLKHSLFFVPPTISYLTLLTNEINGNLFYRNFTLFNTEAEFGPVFYFHTLVSYIFLGLAIYLFMSFSIRNSGLFSKQSVLMGVSILCPLTVNIIITTRIIILPVYYTSIAFSITVGLFFLAITKYQFLNVTPVTMRTILDRMTDGFAVLNDRQELVHYNQAFITTFHALKPRLMVNFLQLFANTGGFENFTDKLKACIEALSATGNPVSFEQALVMKGEERYFQIEITPIYGSSAQFIWGMLVYFKDTTQIHRAIETINHNQAMLMEQQHLASLGQLIGGIAHNLRTPIMSIAGGLEAMRDLVKEYDISIGDETVTTEDHKEIAAEMMAAINRIKPFCSYMSDIISAVKDQAVRLNDSSMSKFTVSELVKRVDILMRLELKKHYFTLQIDNRMPPETEVPGTMNNLIQIMGNIIINAIESNQGNGGKIDLTIEPCRQVAKNIRISIHDNGPGIPESIKDRLFKEMITTKGRNGTGLGLYLSYITIKGKFGGEMWFESEANQGTTFYISIPMLNPSNVGGNIQ